MPTAVINTAHCRVGLSGEMLRVSARNLATEREEVLREIPLRDVERLLLTESAQVSMSATVALMKRGVPLSVLDRRGRFVGSFQPVMPAHGRARLLQYRRVEDRAFALRMAGRIVTAKIYNQRRVLQRLDAGRNAKGSGEGGGAGRCLSGDALRWMEGLLASIRVVADVDELRGYEGAATARYFREWAVFLPAEHPFEQRSRRPPLNPVNACISFGSTLVYNELVSFIHGRGLDPALGVLHATANGRWSLALDLMEPFRPVLVEALALDLFSRGMLGAGHFEERDGGVFLNGEGRKKFFLQYERRIEREFMSECVGHRTCLRQQLENQATLFKRALEQEEVFEPFLMN